MPYPMWRILTAGAIRIRLGRQRVRAWQRGALTGRPCRDQVVDRHDRHARNIWLALVFHGVDGIGWKPTTGAELREYFGYIESKQDKLWVATFQDVAKYMRERMHGNVASYRDGDVISVVLRDDLTDLSYDIPLTLKTFVPSDGRQWKCGRGRGRRG